MSYIDQFAQSSYEENKKEGYRNPIYFMQNYLWENDGKYIDEAGEECASSTRSFGFEFSAFQYAVVAWLTGRCQFLKDFPYPKKLLRMQHREQPIFFIEDDRWRMRTAGVNLFNVMLPRGAGKTSLLLGILAWHLAYERTRMCLYTSNTKILGEAGIKTLKMWLSNSKYVEQFGKAIPDTEDRAFKNTSTMLEIYGGKCIIIAASVGTQIRGTLQLNNRPDFILIDDANASVADAESVETMKKANDWFYTDVYPALDRKPKRANIEPKLICLGTAVHTECLCEELHTGGEFMSIKFGALDEDGDPICGNLTKEFLETTERLYTKKNRLAQFKREYWNDASFRPDMVFPHPNEFTYGNPDFGGMQTFVACDPASTENATKRHDFCSISIVGSNDGKNYWLLENWQEKSLSPSLIIDMVIQFAVKYSPTHVGIESNGAQAAYPILLEERMKLRKMQNYNYPPFIVVPVIPEAKVKKAMRIALSLEPSVRNGTLAFVGSEESMNIELHKQFIDFPKTAHDDGLDSTEMALTLAINHYSDRRNSVQYVHDKEWHVPKQPTDSITLNGFSQDRNSFVDQHAVGRHR